LNIIYLTEINNVKKGKKKKKKGEAAAAGESPWLARYRSQAAGVGHARPLEDPALEVVARPGWAPAYWAFAGRLHARLWARCVPAPGRLHTLAADRARIDRYNQSQLGGCASMIPAFPCVT
jgi:hypothetical protein